MDLELKACRASVADASRRIGLACAKAQATKA
jgi:hypothetical protein